MSENPWRSKEVMQKLYEECDTQKEMAEELDTTEYTISKWIREHSITSHTPKNGVYFREHKQDGHFQINIRDGPVVPEHALSTLAKGADPHRVFADDTHVHHKNCCSYDNRPENVMVVTVEEHQKIHQNEEWARERGYLTPE